MGYKIERLQQQIKMKVAQVILRDLADPRLGLITITEVKLSRDLSHCTILYSVLGDDAELSRCRHALTDARGYVQREVARCLSTRTTPHIEFRYDPSIAGSARVSELLRIELGTTETGSNDRKDDDEPEATT